MAICENRRFTFPARRCVIRSTTMTASTVRTSSAKFSTVARSNGSKRLLTIAGAIARSIPALPTEQASTIKPSLLNATNNRLGVPAGQSGVMQYDVAGNLTNDTYTGDGNRTYDGENKI